MKNYIFLRTFCLYKLGGNIPSRFLRVFVANDSRFLERRVFVEDARQSVVSDFVAEVAAKDPETKAVCFGFCFFQVHVSRAANARVVLAWDSCCRSRSVSLGSHARFTTNGKCAKNSADMYAAGTSSNRIISAVACCHSVKFCALAASRSKYSVIYLWLTRISLQTRRMHKFWPVSAVTSTSGSDCE